MNVRSRTVAAIATTLVTLLLVLGFGRVASAHTELESTTPVADSTVTEPATTVSLTFTQAVEPAAQPIQVFDEQGRPVAIGDVTRSPDGATLSTTLAQPSGNGRFGVLWQVVSADGHTLSDSFEFVVDAPVPATTTTTTTSPPTTTTSPTTTTTTTATTAPATAAPTTTPTTELPSTTSASTATASTDVAAGGDHSGHGDGSALDDALHTHAHGANAWWATPARIMFIGGAVLAVGTIVFALTCVGQAAAERGVLIGIARVAGVFVAVGAALDALSHSSALGGGVADGLGDVLASSQGVAEMLRIGGGLAVALSWAASTATWERLARAETGLAGLRNVPPLAALGIAAMLLSFGFDGHTVSEGPRVVHVGANLVHVGAAATWAGGIFAFATLVVRSRLRAVRPRAVGAAVIEPSEPTRRTVLVPNDGVDAGVASHDDGATRLDTLVVGLQFSSIATLAIVVVAAAGVGMAWFVLDTWSELFDTSWGRTLLIKLGATTIAALMGGLNHFVLLPRLRTDPDDDTVRESLRTIILCEAVMLAIVLVVTAYLVNAAPS